MFYILYSHGKQCECVICEADNVLDSVCIKVNFVEIHVEHCMSANVLSLYVRTIHLASTPIL